MSFRRTVTRSEPVAVPKEESGESAREINVQLRHHKLALYKPGLEHRAQCTTGEDEAMNVMRVDPRSEKQSKQDVATSRRIADERNVNEKIYAETRILGEGRTWIAGS